MLGDRVPPPSGPASPGCRLRAGTGPQPALPSPASAPGTREPCVLGPPGAAKGRVGLCWPLPRPWGDWCYLGRARVSRTRGGGAPLSFPAAKSALCVPRRAKDPEGGEECSSRRFRASRVVLFPHSWPEASNHSVSHLPIQYFVLPTSFIIFSILTTSPSVRFRRSCPQPSLSFPTTAAR